MADVCAPEEKLVEEEVKKEEEDDNDDYEDGDAPEEEDDDEEGDDDDGTPFASFELTSMPNDVPEKFQEGMKYVRAWVNAKVPYSQSHYTNQMATILPPNRTRGQGRYRTDCSGLVSMAWNLPSSYNTRKFFANSFDGAHDILLADPRYKGPEYYPEQVTEIISIEDVRPGDAIYRPGHIMLVTKCVDDDNFVVCHQTRWGPELKIGFAREDHLKRVPSGNGTNPEVGYSMRLFPPDGAYRSRARVHYFLRMKERKEGGEVTTAVA